MPPHHLVSSHLLSHWTPSDHSQSRPSTVAVTHTPTVGQAAARCRSDLLVCRHPRRQAPARCRSDHLACLQPQQQAAARCHSDHLACLYPRQQMASACLAVPYRRQYLLTLIRDHLMPLQLVLLTYEARLSNQCSHSVCISSADSVISEKFWLNIQCWC